MARESILSLFEMQSVDSLSISPDVHLNVTHILRMLFWCSREEWPLFSSKGCFCFFVWIRLKAKKANIKRDYHMIFKSIII